MHIKPILRALKKHKLASFLLALDIALAGAVLGNAGFLVAQRLAVMQMASGVDEDRLGLIYLTDAGTEPAADLHARVLAGLGAIPGVEAVHRVNSVPFGPRAGVAGTSFDAAGEHFAEVVTFYMGDAGTPQDLGLKLVAGGWPAAEDYQVAESLFPADSRVLVTQALAAHYWPGESPLGKEFWMGPEFHFRVGGVVEHLAMQQYTENGERGADWSVFVPVSDGPYLARSYLLRAQPGRIDDVMDEARRRIGAVAPRTILSTEASRTIRELRSEFFRSDRTLAGLLVTVMLALLGVTALGIAGLASFWVTQRRKQIGIRRALGATRGEILRYFQTENFLIVTLGLAIGVVLTIGVNLALMHWFEVARLPATWFVVATVALWCLGQFAVLGPALRASRVSPVVAMRGS